MSEAQNPLPERSDPRAFLAFVLVVAIGGGAIAELSLGAILLAASAWAFWAGSLVWSEHSYGPLDDVLRAGLVALHPAGLLGAFAASSDLSRIAEQPFMVAPPWVALSCSAGGLIGLLVLWIRARRDVEAAPAEALSPAPAYLAGAATALLLGSGTCHLHLGVGFAMSVGFGLCVSFPVVLLQGLTHLLLRRRLAPRRLAAALVLPWLLVFAIPLLATVHANRPETIFRRHLGPIPDSVRAMRVETIRRDLFDNHIEISFEISPADLKRILRRAELRPLLLWGGEPDQFTKSKDNEYLSLTIGPTGRVTLSWQTRFGFP